MDAAAGLLRRVDTIILQFEIPVETVYHTVRFAEQHGVRCIANPAPAVPAHWAQLTDADYFIPNETEAEFIAGQPVQTLEQAHECAARLIQMGFGKVGRDTRRARLAAGFGRREHLGARLRRQGGGHHRG